MNKLEEGKKIFDIEIIALQKTRDSLGDEFVSILDKIVSCEGKVILTGMGKPGHIASKIAATFSSLGTPSFCLDPAEALHGDLGMVSANDIVIAISYSGESDEIIQILPNIKMIGATIIAITANENSTLAQNANITQLLPRFEEACHLGLAPTSSTTVELCYGDALAVVASEIYGFKEVDFGKLHPAGVLGRKLVLRVKDLMAEGEANAVITSASTLKEAIVELSAKGLGIVNIVNEAGDLEGVITDGDLRRLLGKCCDIYNLSIGEVMSKTPTIIEANRLAVDALTMLNTKNISSMPVMNQGKLIGTIRLQDILRTGIVL